MPWVEAVAMATWRDVRSAALALPGASEESREGGKAAWAVNKKFFAWQRPLRPSDLAALGPDAPTGPILGVRTADLEMKEVLLASDPSIFFTTPHFNGYPAVLIPLRKIPPKALRAVLVEAWLARAPKRAVNAYLHEQETKHRRRRTESSARDASASGAR
jgi:hypothetical protein